MTSNPSLYHYAIFRNQKTDNKQQNAKVTWTLRYMKAWCQAALNVLEVRPRLRKQIDAVPEDLSTEGFKAPQAGRNAIPPSSRNGFATCLFRANRLRRSISRQSVMISQTDIQ